MWCFKNAELVESIQIQDRAFHYGDGCFTTARVFEGKIELSAQHLLRLKHSCHYLDLTFDAQIIERSLDQLREAGVFDFGVLKIIVSRGCSHRGYHMPEHDADVYLCFYPQNLNAFQPELIESGLLSQAIGLSMPQLVGLKTLNRLEQVLLRQEADQKNWPEALVSDVQGYLVEGISSNCFIYIKDRWVTPELRYNGVLGTMRAEILNRMQLAGIEVAHAFIDLDEIPHIQSLFFCNALSPMKVVTLLDKQALNSARCITLFDHLKLHQI